MRTTAAILNIKYDLLTLCLDEQFDLFKKLLNSTRGIVDIDYDDGYLIYMAAKKGKFEVVKFLVENGANVRLDDDATLKVAGGYGHCDIVEYLLKRGSNPKVLLYTMEYEKNPKIKQLVDLYLKE